MASQDIYKIKITEFDEKFGYWVEGEVALGFLMQLMQLDSGIY